MRASLEAFFGQSGRGAYGGGFLRPDIDDGLEDAATPPGGGLAGQVGTQGIDGFGRDSAPEQPQPGLTGRAIGAEFDPALTAAADLINSGSDDLWAPAEFGLASTGASRSWWRQGEGVARFNDGVLSPVALDSLAEGLSASVGAEQLSQHQKLTQALASFGRDKGASAAVWKRSGEAEVEAASQMLGASGSRFAALARMPA
ncbi:hypothetical protein D3C85_1124810 [compost metagenome]